MPKQTIAERLRGCVETKRTTHYRVFIPKCSTTAPTLIRIYVGKAGALRFSRSGKVTDSAACPMRYREAVLANSLLR